MPRLSRRSFLHKSALLSGATLTIKLLPIDSFGAVVARAAAQLRNARWRVRYSLLARSVASCGGASARRTRASRRGTPKRRRERALGS
jgi:hypothetical protein